MNIIHNELFYSSGTIVASGDTGIIATPLSGRMTSNPDVDLGLNQPNVVVPLYFTHLGADMTIDETCTLTMNWYMDAAGAYTHGVTTFVAMTWTDLDPASEYWPGDIDRWDGADKYRPPWVPLPPYCQINWALVGAAKSMSFTVRMSYLVM